MNNDLNQEKEYLKETLKFLAEEIKRESTVLSDRRNDMVETNKIMWEQTSRRGVTWETVPYLDNLLSVAHSADYSDKRIRKYEQMLSSPYFGRIDLVEEGFEDEEKIYIGYYNLMDAKKMNVYVYDWRAPISSVFYRFEPGDCFYDSPQGRISGNMRKKRQYQIEGGKLKFFFDSSVAIRDELLMLALSQNSSVKMKNIVETIQKEQDIIIRDMTHKTLIVQGVAGSGKTSVALHRAAFLLYGENQKPLNKKDIIILSPNNVFSDYIDSVLPSLGEENVAATALNEIYQKEIKGTKIQTKNKLYEVFINERDEVRREKLGNRTAFLCSDTFKKIIDDYVVCYEEKYMFKDVVIEENVVYKGSQLKEMFLDNKAGISVFSRLKRLERRVVEHTEPYYEEIYKKNKKIVYDDPKLRFEEEEQLSKIMAKLREDFESKVKKQFEINALEAYKEMLLSENMPKYAEKPIRYVLESLKKGILPYDAAAGVLYLKLILSGKSNEAGIKHVVIDEAQDYYPLHYHIFAQMFKGARFTILGDTNQSVEIKNDNIYGKADIILADGKAEFVKLEKSYRSSKEITEFANKINRIETSEGVERTGGAPETYVCISEKEMLEKVLEKAESYVKEGLHRIAVITKSYRKAKEISEKIKFSKEVSIMPVYTAKGLEFDAVIVYNASKENYSEKSEYDRNLLYIACTRALHKLSLFANDSLSEIVPKS